MTHLQKPASEGSREQTERVGKASAKVACAHTEIWPLEKFVPHPRNPNRHPAEQLRLLGKVIISNGWRSPVCVSRRSGFVIKGHGRLEAARMAGLESAPVDLQDYAKVAEYG